MEIPAPIDVLMATLLVGLLFMLRFWLAMRRLPASVGNGQEIERYRAATRPMSFGRENEPSRRHAARQLQVGLLCVSFGLVLGAWLLLAPVFGWPPPWVGGPAA